MAKLASIFISPRHLRMLGILVWMSTFLACLVLLGGFALHRIDKVVRDDIADSLAPYVRMGANISSTFEALHRDVTAEPCGAEFQAQLRKVAFLPDGISEFFYAPGGVVRCTVNVPLLEPAIDLGEPDFRADSSGGTAIWIARDLSFAGLVGEVGTISLRDPFAMVVPPLPVELRTRDWVDAEAVFVEPGGRWWSRGGVAGVHQRALIARAAGGWSSFPGLRWTRCVTGGLHCVTMEARLGALLRDNLGGVSILTLLSFFVASWVTRHARAAVSRYWSFDARFRRNLDIDSVVCAYQPLLHLPSGAIAGCEVLARWRDLDDALVYPDRFIPVVEKHGLTRELTSLVVERAFRDLSVHVPPGGRLQVNFNIFPCDLDAPTLIAIFAPFAELRDRFDVVLEIVETDALPAHRAQAAIDELRQAGFHVYIDDFGTGYSNLHNLVDLAVDGVKLDRCFAMAPADSLMCAMLDHAVDMVQAAGRAIVVEGVETAERLARLQSDSRRIDFAQGYHISRPLDIEGFARFLAHSRTSSPRARAA